ncbi:hypothetical protein ACHQM5_014396 [Ranunculus cassubicifolius]
MAPAATGSKLSKFLPSIRLQSMDIQAAAMWDVAAGTTAFWIVQTWLRNTIACG